MSLEQLCFGNELYFVIIRTFVGQYRVLSLIEVMIFLASMKAAALHGTTFLFFDSVVC